jgi:hypothetical protein
MHIGIIDTWPGIKNAEYELIIKLQGVLERLGHSSVLIDNTGHIVAVEGDQRIVDYKTSVNDDDIDFVLSLHYESGKVIDSFTFFTLWNPPDFTLNIPDDYSYSSIKDRILSVDDYLEYGARPIKSYVQNVTHDFYKETDGMLQLSTSTDSAQNLEPNLDDPKLFYCGINWEKCTAKRGRHHELFKALDDLGLMRIYGPRVFQGMRPWDGYKSYEGELPFDGGRSMIKAINNCGISLVLSSNSHRVAEAATNRLYESLAAGAVIISDDNEFVKREFGDSILYIEYSSDCQFMKNQILDHLEWVTNNKQLSLKKAEVAQKIFTEKFCLRKQMESLCAQFSERRVQVYAKCHSASQSQVIDIVALYDKPEFSIKEADILLSNVSKQLYNNYNLIIICDRDIESDFKGFVKSKGYLDAEIIPIKLFNRENNIIIGWGKIIMEIIDKLKGQYLALISTGQLWFRDHLAKLAFVLESNKELDIVYSGYFIYGRGSNDLPLARRLVHEKIQDDNFNSYPVSTMLITTYYIKQLPNYTLHFIDNALPNLLLCAGKDKSQKSSYNACYTCGVSHLNEITKSEIKVIKDFLSNKTFVTLKREEDVLVRIKHELKARLSPNSKLFIILRFFYLTAKKIRQKLK